MTVVADLELLQDEFHTLCRPIGAYMGVGELGDPAEVFAVVCTFLKNLYTHAALTNVSVVTN